MVEEDIYTYRKLPWMSKSTILGYRFCQHLFMLRYIQGVSHGVGISAETGTNMHVIYAKFFETLDYEKVKKIVVNYTEDLENTKIYKYFFKHMMEMIPPTSRTFEPYQIRVKNFALLETAHWIELNRKYKENFNKIMKFFVPLMMEKYLECDPLMIFGTVDRKGIYEDDDKLQVIYDYKTGHVPKDVKKGTKTNDPFSWTLATTKSFELHYYMVLEMFRRGFTLDPEIVAFCTEEKYFYSGVKFPDVKNYFYDSKGDPVNPRDYYRLGIIYTGGDEPWVPKKYPNKRSLKSVFVWINKIRTILTNDGPFNKEPTYWKCRNCNEDVQKECLNEQEHAMIFWGEAAGSTENV